MSLTKISGFAALTSYLGLAGAATVLRSNPRTLAIIAATGFVFDLIQANTRGDERGPRRHRGIPLVDPFHFHGGGRAGGAGSPVDSSDEELDPAPRAGSAGGACAAPRAEEVEPTKFAKLVNKVSKLFHSFIGGASWFSQKININNTFAYHYAKTFYSLTINFYAGSLPRRSS